MKKIKVTLDRIEGNYGILIAPSREELRIPKKYFPDQKKGSVFSIDVKSEEEAKSSDEKLAKAILNEILNPKS